MGSSREWDGYIVGDATQGEGVNKIVSGSYFDYTRKNYVEVVLNKGTGAEIRGERFDLPIGEFRMVTDDEEPAAVIGAVTDGAAKIRLQLRVEHNRDKFSNLMWQVINPQLNDSTVGRGTLLNKDGNPTETVFVDFDTNGLAEAVYQVPDGFVRWGTPEEDSDKTIPERYIQPTLDIAYYLLTKDEILPPITLKRPPVILVHGLWGSADAWDVFEPIFNDRGLYDVFRVDYSEEGRVSSISQHVIELKYIFEDIYDSLKKQDFAVKKVDIIAHSLGGLLTREYCEQFNSECHDRIRRFITIATPHFGSELADILLVYRDDINKFPSQPLCIRRVNRFINGGPLEIGIGGLFSVQVRPHPIVPRGGAIDDLATGILPYFIQSSTIAGRWVNYSSLSDTFSSHTIVGITTPALMGIHHEIWGLWKFILSKCGFNRENVFGAEAELNDRIVKKSSQQGGVIDQYSTTIWETDHFTVRNSFKTIDQIKLLLDEPMNSEKFTK